MHAKKLQLFGERIATPLHATHRRSTTKRSRKRTTAKLIWRTTEQGRVPQKCESAKRRYEWTKKYFSSPVEGPALLSLTGTRNWTEGQRLPTSSEKNAISSNSGKAYLLLANKGTTVNLYLLYSWGQNKKQCYSSSDHFVMTSFKSSLVLCAIRECAPGAFVYMRTYGISAAESLSNASSDWMLILQCLHLLP